MSTNAERLREFRRQNPGRDLQYRITAAINLLQKHGYTVSNTGNPAALESEEGGEHSGN